MLAGRLTATHSQIKPLSFLEIRQEAYGVLGMHPWEFRKYTLECYLIKRDGFYNNRRIQLQTEFQHVRLLCYFSVWPHLTKAAQKKPYTEIIPDLYEKATKKEDYQKWFDDRRKQAKEWKDRLSKTKLKVVGK